MPAVNLSPILNATTITDSFGNTLAGGQILSYQAGSTTPLATYSDSNGTIARTNPITIGVDGKVSGLIWLQVDIAYKFVVQTNTGIQIAVYDNIAGVVTAIPAIQLLPAGIIVIWSGALGNIPAGWFLCDGQNGRPDLRDKFIVGAGNLYPPTTQGGSANSIVVAHTHVANVIDPGHTHTVVAQPAGGSSGAFPGGLAAAATTITTSSNPTNVSVTINSSGASGVGANLPPYYSFAYIIKT